METPPATAWPPEGRLIEDARERLSLSQNEAARRAGMSGSRWRQIVYRDASSMTSRRGVAALARMAQVVQVHPDRFAQLGRDDIAAQLRQAEGIPEEDATDDQAGQRVRLEVIINDETPEPDMPPGGFRNQSERVIWALTDHPWQARWAAIKAAREVMEARQSRRQAPPASGSGPKTAG